MDSPVSKLLVDRIDEYLEAASERHIAFLQQLLSIPTPRMQEHRAMRFVADALKAAGCRVDVFEGQGMGEPLPDGPPLNVFAVRSGRGNGRSLMLEAHLDTVPPGDPTRWHYDPWSAKIEDGRIYARGAHDDRSGVALLCLLAEVLNELKINLSGDLALLGTTEEEFSAGGMRAFKEKYKMLCPNAHVLVDGNEAPHLCIVAHPAPLSFEIRILGPFGTSQDMEKKDANPIELAAKLVARLPGFKDEIAKENKKLGAAATWPEPILSVTGIHSTGWISNFPEECVLTGWCSVIPPMIPSAYQSRFEKYLHDFCRENTWLQNNPITIQWGPLEVPAMQMSEDSEFFRVLSGAHRESFNTALEPRTIGGWADMGLLGSPNMILYGPGGGGNCHGYNEYYELKDLAPMLKALTLLAIRWCGVAEAKS